MRQYLVLDEWKIIEKGFKPELQELSESIFSLGNGRMGQRANFEEAYSGSSLQGNYVAGIYYPDKTKVGWWKNGYPEYFAKVLNSTNWIGINVSIDNEELDLFKCKVSQFSRVLNMKEGFLEREFVAEFKNGKKIKVNSKRFLSIVDTEIGAIRYSITPINFDGNISFNPYVDADVVNQDSNYDEKFWAEIEKRVLKNKAFLNVRTKKLDFHLSTGIAYEIFQDSKKIELEANIVEKEKYIGFDFMLNCKRKVETVVYKYVANLSSENYDKGRLMTETEMVLEKALNKSFANLLEEQKKAWSEKWEECDIQIKGDVAAQQGIRFNIFQLNQTYTGEDERLNIGPKGFTGEKYGGSTYWDTEAFCLPFYLSTAESHVAKNLLLYRYKQLGKAIENAQKLGFDNGAALFPMVTMNGEECHNEWEITFEEIHRNGAIAYAIYNYVNYTGDKEYLAKYGLEVLIAIARYWSQRITYSQEKKMYVMLGVTGPNEYENNVNNNWYTNTIACWSMKYVAEAATFVRNNFFEDYQRIIKKVGFDDEVEILKWREIVNNMYFPYDEKKGIFLQQEGYLDKEQILVKDIDKSNLPLNQNWSWDRILRSCFIKQADVLQGLYIFEQDYNLETIRKNFDFYEPRTVHESSLSPCVHSIIASKIGDNKKAYELYLRTSRLDLDDYNDEVAEGCHITSMAGTWLAIVHGFGGMRVKNGKLLFNPTIPKQWDTYSFNINFRDYLLNIEVLKKQTIVTNNSKKAIEIKIYGNNYKIQQGKSVFVNH
ncbi:MAG: glycoside hydrolase family 65 protein [Bacteroidetes bacterium]|nr:MAG: glycoside hydrolase family 65 protein [Bacteroidota bacterium]